MSYKKLNDGIENGEVLNGYMYIEYAFMSIPEVVQGPTLAENVGGRIPLHVL